jgi:hypothetical protein
MTGHGLLASRRHHPCCCAVNLGDELTVVTVPNAYADDPSFAVDTISIDVGHHVTEPARSQYSAGPPVEHLTQVPHYDSASAERASKQFRVGVSAQGGSDSFP